MSISSTNSRNNYTGNNTTATYNYTFRILDQDDLLVTVRDTSDVETTLTISTDYTVTGVGSLSGGTIVLTAGNLATGYVLSIRRVVPLVQETDIRNQGAFYPEIHEDQFDRQVMMAQQQQDEVDRAVKLAETIDPDDFDTRLPASIVGSINQTVMTNATGDGFEPGPTADEVSNAQGYATAASASATASAASASAAATSASAAAASASAAAVNAAASLWNDVYYLTSASSPFNVGDLDAGALFEVDCSGGAVVINLPAISSLTLTGPWSIGVKKSDSSANAITINRNGTDTIDGATSKTISRQYAGCSLIPDTDQSPDKWTSLTFGEVPVAGAIVGTTDAQTLTNKDIDGGTASNSNRITVPKNTTTNLSSLTRKAGTLVYDTTTNLLNVDNGTNLVEIDPVKVYAIYKESTGQSLGTGVEIINFNTSEFDSHNAVTTGASWKFTAPISRMYTVFGAIRVDTAVRRIDLYKNGSFYRSLFEPSAVSETESYSTMLYLNATDYIDIRANSGSAAGLFADARFNYICISAE